MHTADIRHNRSGYYDGTAYKAIISADRSSRKKRERKAVKMGKRENAVGMAGRIAGEIEKQPDIYGASGLKRFFLEIQRSGGSSQDSDRVIVIYGQEADATPGQLKDGAYVMVMGKMQTYKEVPGGHIVVFVLAEYVGAVTEKVEQQNGVYLEGVVARKPIHRTTPLGKKITEVVVKVPSAFTEGYFSFVPTICWKEYAEWAATCQEGARVALEGRLQSREYKKRLDGVEAVLTAYEVSAQYIEKR